MEKPLKIFGFIVLSLFLIIIVLVVVASLSQNKIADFTLKKISKSINAPVEIEEVSFTLIKRFPFATIELSGVRIGTENSTVTDSNSLSKEDILKFKRVYISFKTIPIMKGIYEIDNIEIDDATVNYEVDSSGHSNIDFLLNLNEEDTDTVNSESVGVPNFDLKKVKLKNTLVHYVNDSVKMAATMFFHVLDIKGKMENEKIKGTAAGEVQVTNSRFGSTNLNRMEQALVIFELYYETDTLKIKKLIAETDGAKLDISGKMAFSEPLFTNLAIELKDGDLVKFHKYVPDELLNKYGIEALTGNVNLSGSVAGFVSDSILPSVDFTLNLKNGFIKIKDYPTVKNLNFEGKISNGSQRNNKTASAHFKTFHAETETSSADLTFSIVNFEKPVYDIQSKLKINMKEFSDFIPDSIIQNISGKFIAEISTKGQIPDSVDDNFINLIANNTEANVDFSKLTIDSDSLQINDFSGSLIYAPKHLSVKNLNGKIPEWELQLKNSSLNADFKGQFTQPRELEIILNSFKTETQQGNFWGTAKINNLEYPDFVINANAKIDLEEIKPFIPDSLVKNISGNLEAEISTHGKLNLDSVTAQLTDILFNQSSLKLIAKNISLAMPDTLQEISDLNGEMKIDNGTITISKMNGIAAGIDFLVDSTTILNVYEAVIKNKKETVKAQGNLEFGAIDYAILEPFFPSDSSEEHTNQSSPLNFLFELKGKVAAKSFKYDKIFLENISAKFNLTDSVYIIDQFKTNAFDGSTNSSLRYSITKNDRQILNVKNQIDNMDIYKLLYAFNNFGQDSLISYKNISGIITADINSRVVFEADSMVSNDMRVMGNFKLENGKLINYKPAMDVSNFTGIKELDNIEMKTLESNIFMFKNKIYVPITNIVSSSMDLSTSGMQSLSEDYEYLIKLNLGEILKGKSRKLFERQSRSGDEISENDMDKNTIKLIYAYLDGKKKVGFATKKAQRQLALKIEVQQTMLELIFHPTLVSYDTGVK